MTGLSYLAYTNDVPSRRFLLETVLRIKELFSYCYIFVYFTEKSTVSTAEVRVVTIRADRPGTGWVKRKPGTGTSTRPPSDEVVPKSGSTSSTAYTSTGATAGAAGDSGDTRKKKGNVIPLALYRTANARYTVVYSHGNATDIGAMHDRCAGIAKEVGVNVLAYDYTGYGAAT